MNSTTSSTGELDNVLRRVVLSPWKQQLDSILAELEHRRAQAPDPAKQPDPAAQARSRHANAVKTSRLDTAINAAIERHRLQLPDVKGSRTSRATWLRNQIAMTLTLAENGGEVPAGYEAFKRTPGWRTIYGKLKKLSL